MWLHVEIFKAECLFCVFMQLKSNGKWMNLGCCFSEGCFCPPKFVWTQVHYIHPCLPSKQCCGCNIIANDSVFSLSIKQQNKRCQECEKESFRAFTVTSPAHLKFLLGAVTQQRKMCRSVHLTIRLSFLPFALPVSKEYEALMKPHLVGSHTQVQCRSMLLLLSQLVVCLQ